MMSVHSSNMEIQGRSSAEVLVNVGWHSEGRKMVNHLNLQFWLSKVVEDLSEGRLVHG